MSEMVLCEYCDQRNPGDDWAYDRCPNCGELDDEMVKVSERSEITRLRAENERLVAECDEAKVRQVETMAFYSDQVEQFHKMRAERDGLAKKVSELEEQHDHK